MTCVAQILNSETAYLLLGVWVCIVCQLGENHQAILRASPMDSPHKGPVLTVEMFPLTPSSWFAEISLHCVNFFRAALFSGTATICPYLRIFSHEIILVFCVRDYIPLFHVGLTELRYTTFDHQFH